MKKDQIQKDRLIIVLGNFASGMAILLLLLFVSVEPTDFVTQIFRVVFAVLLSLLSVVLIKINLDWVRYGKID